MSKENIFFRFLPKSWEARTKKKLQLDPAKEWSEDRKAEVLEYFSQGNCTVTLEKVKKSIEAQDYLKLESCDAFEHSDGMTPKGLFDAYRASSVFLIQRFMLAYDRVRQALPLVNLALRRAPGSPILDYGCGVSDTGLVFAAFGFQVSICDVGGGNLEFARWRYGRRDIPVTAIRATEEDIYPELGENLAFISALEVLEHLPNPSRALEKIHRALRPGGVFVIREESFEARDHEDHLESAYEEYKSGTYAKVRDSLFRDLSPKLGRRFKGSRYMKVYEKR